jgi:ABC-type multidrug transport system permease subunit
MINVIILYFMIGLADTARQFFIFYLTYFLLGFAGASMGLLIGSVILDAKSVSAVVPIIILPLMLFSGYFKNNEDLPGWIGWLQYISPIKYGLIAFVTDQVEGKPSLINELNFDLGLWPSIFILLGLGMGYRLLSVFFLAVLKTRTQ